MTPTRTLLVFLAAALSGEIRLRGEPLSGVPFVAFDLETTGLSPKTDRVIEIGAVRFRDGKALESRSWLINPGMPIPEASQRIHHITDEMVANRPAFPAVYAEFMQFMGDSVLLSHNARFDMGFLTAEARRHGAEPVSNPVLDTLRLARRWFPEARSHALQDLADALKLSSKEPHRAPADAETLFRVFLAGSAKSAPNASLEELTALAGIAPAAVEATGDEPVSGSASVPMEAKLSALVIPEVAFLDAAAADAFEFLVQSARNSEKDRGGLNMVLSLSPEERTRTVTYKRRGATLMEILSDVSRLTAIPIEVRGNLVVIGKPRATPRNAVRAYSVPWTLMDDIKKAGARKYLEELGVPFPEGATARYSPATGKLIVSNTPENIRMLDRILTKLGVAVGTDQP